MPKRVLLTGAGGFLGSHILRHLLVNTDWDIVALDSFSHKGKTDRIVQQQSGITDANKRITVLSHDLTVPFSWQFEQKIGPVEYILSVASESHVDRSIISPRDFVMNNVSLVLTLLDYARGQRSLDKFIQISTDEVYGPAPEAYRHKEGESHKPSNPYSASKAAQEDICFAYWRTYQLPIIITNTMNIIGELQDPEKYIPMTIKRIRRGETVNVHASKDGSMIGSRFYLHARNQADALLYILNNITPAMYGDDVNDIDRFNIVGEREVSNLELAQLVAMFVGKDLKYELTDFHSSRPGHDLRYALDGNKMTKLGWRAPLSFEESLQKTVEWTLKHPEWLHDD